MSYWVALLLAIAGNIGANISFKHFIQSTDLDASWNSVWVALSHSSFWIGMMLGLSLLGCYLYAIKALPLSVAYTTATSLSIVGVTCAGVFIYGETLGFKAVLGIAIVLLGVYLVTTA